MIIKKITLTNYCQHTSRTIDIAGNLIAVVGANGKGKSNLLGAIQFALTGEQPGKNKADLLHWGAKEGSVVLEFEQDGKSGRIDRSVGANKVTLEYDGNITSGITAVAKEMEERLHMDKDLVKQSVFVRQTEVDTIISAKTDKRDREVAFQKLLGIDAAKIHKNLTDWMYAAEKPVNYDIQLTDAEHRLGELSTRKAELDTAVAAAEAAVLDAGSIDESADISLKNGIAVITAVIQAKTELDTCDKAVRDWEATLSNVKADAKCGDNPGVDVATKAEEISVLKDELRKAQDYTASSGRLSKEKDDLDYVLGKAHPTEDEVASAEDALRKVSDELSVATHEVSVRRKAVSSLTGGESVCPVCGKPLDADTAEHLSRELEEWVAKEKVLTAECADKSKEYVTARDALNSWKTQVDAHMSAFNREKELYDKLPVPQLDETTAGAALTVANGELLAQKTYDSRVASHKQAIAGAELKLSVAQASKKAALGRYDTAVTKARELCGLCNVDDWSRELESRASLVKAADQRRKHIVDLQVALSSVTATRDEAERMLKTLTQTVEDLKDAQAVQDVLSKKLATLERVRDWFSYQNGPRVLVQQVLGALTDDVNRFLGNFTAPFVVTPDQEQLGFKVQFTDGRDRPNDPPGTDVLSGGERVQLAVAFRLAIYCMFAGKLGLLSLDEPTAYLDDGNVDRFGILLGKVRDLARNMNTQVFMATHERSVIPHMDSVIDLN